jgi:tetratricopeptide (TPR) repeat protein
MQLLATKFDYRGRMRVMISNLEQLPDLEPACRNAFEKSAAEIEREVDAYWKAGVFSTTSVSGRTLSPTRDLHVQPATGNDVKLAMADLLLSTGSDQASAAYGAMQGLEADEGLGLIALAKKDAAESRKRLEAAIKADSKNARAWAELALLESDEANARKELIKAGELNPRWAEVPHRVAALEKDAARKADQLKKACKLDPRDAAAWEELARAQIDAKQFVEAQKAWAGAERAAASDAERERIHRERLEVDRERADFETSERKRESDERQRDINRVKQAGMAEIHAAEDQANRKLNSDGAKPLGKVEEWWTGPEAGSKLSGTLERVDCLGRQARLVVRGSDGVVVQLLVRDPGQIVLSGGGVKTLGCGPQRPPRAVTVQYAPKPDKKLGTAGEAAAVEFR